MAWKQDCKFITRFAQSNADALAFVQSGVILTKQFNTRGLNKATHELKIHGKTAQIENWEQKRLDVYNFNTHCHYFYDEMMKINRSKGKDYAKKILSLFLEVSGLGLAKANFMAQMATSHRQFVCLDSVNCKEYGIKTSVLDYNKKATKATKEKKIDEYFDTVNQIAKDHGALSNPSEFFWDTWCHLTANNYPKSFKSYQHVSFLHRCWFTKDVDLNTAFIHGEFDLA